MYPRKGDGVEWWVCFVLRNGESRGENERKWFNGGKTVRCGTHSLGYLLRAVNLRRNRRFQRSGEWWPHLTFDNHTFPFGLRLLWSKETVHAQVIKHRLGSHVYIIGNSLIHMYSFLLRRPGDGKEGVRLYASDNDVAAMVRNLMSARGVTKDPGLQLNWDWLTVSRMNSLLGTHVIRCARKSTSFWTQWRRSWLKRVMTLPPDDELSGGSEREDSLKLHR